MCCTFREAHREKYGHLAQHDVFSPLFPITVTKTVPSDSEELPELTGFRLSPDGVLNATALQGSMVPVVHAETF